MKRFIALFRGINVGGNNKLPMKDLVALLEGLGLQNVRTYIQSGNAIFASQEDDVSKLINAISTAIKEHHGFKPQIILLTSEALDTAIASNPFPEAETASKTLHLYFLADTPKSPDLNTLDTLKQNGEQFQLIDSVFYLHAPAGIGRSKLAARVEKALGVAVTARNWNSVCNIKTLT